MSNTTEQVLVQLRQGLNYRIRRAGIDDAAQLYTLLCKELGFGIQYTIYQSPKAISYLRKIIDGEPVLGYHHVVVLTLESQLVGFYHATKRDARFFLNNIAVVADVHGQGLGSLLLSHFEQAGREADCNEAALDVFERNEVALRWYWRRGYKSGASFYHVRLRIDDWCTENSPSLVCEKESLRQAIVEEEIQGFSKVDCSLAGEALVIGLISKNSCKLLQYHDLEVSSRAVAHTFHRQRDFLILSGVDTLPVGGPVHQHDRYLRLTKSLG
jgi:ribosomal protein S18 acetylase RimI-like enzyme